MSARAAQAEKATAPSGAPTATGATKRSADTVRRLHDELRRLLMQFEIPPDERINEVELARRLSVSRTPLREALNRLVTEDLLTFEPNRGFRCRTLDTKDVFDLYEARAVVEVAAIRLACRRAEARDIEALEAFWAGVAALDDHPATALLAKDEEFHERLAALSGNAELKRALRGINARIHFVRWMDLERPERRTTTYTEHAELLAALRRRDEAACVSIMTRHIERRLDEIVEVIKVGVVHLFYRCDRTGRVSSRPLIRATCARMRPPRGASGLRAGFV